MTAPFVIGCAAGFAGDRIDAAETVIDSLVEAAGRSALMFETLAERTLALGQTRRAADPELGYDMRLERMVRPVLQRCHAAGVPIIGNFGAANPPAAARTIAGWGAELGLKDFRVAHIAGDDFRDSFDPSKVSSWEGGGPDASEFASGILAASVYIGAREISEALKRKADVVVAGRVSDPSLAVGPLMAHFGWAWDDWDRIATATLAGHLLECGTQVTGGYFADPGIKDVPGMDRLGFPIAEVQEDGTIVITKAPGTGGMVTEQTVKEQILYEMHNPAAYLTPDVILDVTGVTLRQIGPDRVELRGARGKPRPETLKSIVCYAGEWLGEAEISYAGPNAAGRAKLAAETVRNRLGHRGLAPRIRTDVIGLVSVFDDQSGHLARSCNVDDCTDARMRLAVGDPNPTVIEHCLEEVEALYVCGPAAGGGVRKHTQFRFRTASFLVPQDQVRCSFSFVEPQ